MPSDKLTSSQRLVVLLLSCSPGFLHCFCWCPLTLLLDHPRAHAQRMLMTALLQMCQDCYLAYYLTELAGATFIIFTRTVDHARKLAYMLRALGFDAVPIHGQMSQPKRLAALNKFKGGERSILVATGEGLP